MIMIDYILLHFSILRSLASCLYYTRLSTRSSKNVSCWCDSSMHVESHTVTRVLVIVTRKNSPNVALCQGCAYLKRLKTWLANCRKIYNLSYFVVFVCFFIEMKFYYYRNRQIHKKGIFQNISTFSWFANVTVCGFCVFVRTVDTVREFTVISNQNFFVYLGGYR